MVILSSSELESYNCILILILTGLEATYPPCFSNLVGELGAAVEPDYAFGTYVLADCLNVTTDTI